MVTKEIDDHADFIFEVPPDPQTFDAVRRVVVSSLRTQYGDLIAGDIREHVRVDSVVLDPVEWHVEGAFDGDSEFGFEVMVDADGDATDDVLGYLRGCVDRRYGDTVDAQAVVYDSVSLRPRVWFVDAKVPATAD
jgi:hypothetical protein